MWAVWLSNKVEAKLLLIKVQLIPCHYDLFTWIKILYNIKYYYDLVNKFCTNFAVVTVCQLEKQINFVPLSQSRLFAGHGQHHRHPGVPVRRQCWPSQFCIISVRTIVHPSVANIPAWHDKYTQFPFRSCLTSSLSPCHELIVILLCNSSSSQ